MTKRDEPDGKQVGFSSHEGGGSTQGVTQQVPCKTMPAGHVPASDKGVQTCLPPQSQGCTQYSVAEHVFFPHVMGPPSPGGGPDESRPLSPGG